MKFLIVDGLSETRNNFRKHLEISVPNAGIYESTSAEDALFAFIDHEINIIISSEILSFRSGFELSRIVQKLNPDVPVIIIANDDSNAVEAIRNRVFNLLLEPINPKQFEIVINQAISHIESSLSKSENDLNQNMKIRICLKSGFKLIDIEDLAYCFADGAYTNLCYINGGTDCTSYNLGKVEKQLLKYQFLRINRSTIVNLKLLKHIDKHKKTCEIEVAGKLTTFKITLQYFDKLVNHNFIKY